jgi:Secretion system C-terminal sorting domain
MGTFEGFPYSDTVDTFTFWYKCDVQPGDSAICIVELRKAGVAYSTNIYRMGGTVTTWTEVSMPLPGGATEEPDSVFVGFASSDPMSSGSAEEGSALEVDFVNFEFNAGSTTPSAIPNNSFEDLFQLSADLPDDWFTFDDIAFFMTGESYIAESGDASTGASALEITTTVGNVVNDVPSIATNGWYDFGIDDFAGGTPFIAQPDNFSYDAKYAASGVDTAIMWLVMWNDATGTLIDTFDIILPTAGVYATQNIALTLTEAPDSVFVLYYSGTQAGSVLLVDNIQFTGGDISVGAEPLFSELRVHPNPANGYTTILFDMADEIEIVNIAGRQMFQSSHIESNKMTIDTQDWDGGVYFVRVNKAGKMLTKKLIITH